MKQDDLRFAIDQLRKDKIIYATEAGATTLICILGFLFVRTYVEGPQEYILNVLIVTVGVGYTIFMGVGNLIRLQTIRKLEKRLGQRTS